MEQKKDKYSIKYYPGKITAFQHNGRKLIFIASDTLLELTIVTDKILRFRYAANGHFQDDFSYAVVNDFKSEPASFKLKDDKQKFVITTKELTCRIYKKNLKTVILNKKRKVICEDETGYHWQHYILKGGKINYCSKKIQQGEYFYGLGDKATEFNLRGKRFENYGQDTYGFRKDQDPLYKNIPFYIGLHHSLSYGIFFDNTFRTIFDFGKESSEVCSFWARGGEMNYYFIYGPEMVNVAEQYALLTGTPELPPMWALGYQQSKWSYFPEKKVREIATEFRRRKIPCDAIYLDIDYMDGYRCFTWNKKYFPDPSRLIRQLEKSGFKVVTIIDPGIKEDKNYNVFRDALKHDYFCKRADGEVMEGDVWPGKCNFPDFTNPVVREWWAREIEELRRTGIRGIWNDMNEPAVFELGTFPEDVRHDYDGHPCSHRKAHNIYGMQMVRSSWEGLKGVNGHIPDTDHRPLNITRSGYSGVQRYAATWTGDSVSEWEHLWMASIQCQRLSISGLSFCGTDIGGFIGNPDGELYLRWLQLSTFHPFFRGHYAGLDKGVHPREPWSYGPRIEFIARKFISLRYRMLPYFYTAFWQYVQRGTPMIRPIVMHDQSDPETLYRQEEFLVGDKILVCPISKQGRDGRNMYLPKGRWYNFWNDKEMHGGHEFWVEASLEHAPMFVHEGSIIPNYPNMQYVGEHPVHELTLHIYFANRVQESEIYEDTGDGYGYQNGQFNVCKFLVKGNKNHFKIYQAHTSQKFQPTYKYYKVVIHGLPFHPKKCLVDGNAHPLGKRNFALGTVKFQVKRNFEEIILKR